MKTLFWVYRSRVDKMGQSLTMLRLIIASVIKNISTGVRSFGISRDPLPCCLVLALIFTSVAVNCDEKNGGLHSTMALVRDVTLKVLGSKTIGS
ncbi:MAG: hypothetical protein CK547_02785 [Chitinophagaceae bacterium]|nr:MAG: hypothetical protein CK547_02785 [Chitinophagaceae bacterium]